MRGHGADYPFSQRICASGSRTSFDGLLRIRQILHEQAAIIALHQRLRLLETHIGIPRRLIPPRRVTTAMDLVADVRATLLLPQFGISTAGYSMDTAAFRCLDQFTVLQAKRRIVLPILCASDLHPLCHVTQILGIQAVSRQGRSIFSGAFLAGRRCGLQHRLKVKMY